MFVGGVAWRHTSVFFQTPPLIMILILASGSASQPVPVPVLTQPLKRRRSWKALGKRGGETSGSCRQRNLGNTLEAPDAKFWPCSQAVMMCDGWRMQRGRSGQCDETQGCCGPRTTLSDSRVVSLQAC